MRPLLLQIAAVTVMNLKSLRQRLWLSLSTIVAVALVVIVLLALGLLDRPARLMYSETGIVVALVQVQLVFMVISLSAAMHGIDGNLIRAARSLGAGAWRGFWKITFPLMLPVSLTAVVLRIIFELKLADIVINVTAGGPGGATDTVSSFIYREYRDRSNVGYGTMLA